MLSNNEHVAINNPTIVLDFEEELSEAIHCVCQAAGFSTACPTFHSLLATPDINDCVEEGESSSVAHRVPEKQLSPGPQSSELPLLHGWVHLSAASNQFLPHQKLSLMLHPVPSKHFKLSGQSESSPLGQATAHF